MAWEVKKLEEVCEIVTGTPPNYEGEKDYFSTGAISNDEFDIPEKVTYKDRPSRANSYPKTGDVGFAKMKFTNKVVLINSKLNGSIFSTGFCFLRPNDSLDSRYLFHFIISDIFQKLKDQSAGAGIMGGIKNSDVRHIEIPIPPLSEQKRIVAMLDKIIENLTKTKVNAEKNLKNTNEVLETILHDIFENKGEGWEQIKLGELATFRNGINFTKSSKGELIRIVGVKDFQKSFWVPLEGLESVTIDGKLNETDFLEENDILTVRSNGNPELIGRTLIAGNVKDKVSHSGFTIRIRLNSKSIYPLYLCHYLKTKKSRKELVESGTGVNIKSLNQVALSSLLISFPKSISEQQSIIQKLNIISAKTKNLYDIYEKKLTNLDELKQSILQKAFNGELIEVSA